MDAIKAKKRRLKRKSSSMSISAAAIYDFSLKYANNYKIANSVINRILRLKSKAMEDLA